VVDIEIHRGHVFLLGGTTASPTSRASPTLPKGYALNYQFDPAGAYWSSFTQPVVARSGGCCWAHKRWLFSYGGWNAATVVVGSLSAFETSGRTWTTLPSSYTSQGAFPTGAAVLGQGYVTGGAASGVTQGTSTGSVSHTQFDFPTRLWTAKTSLPYKRQGAAGGEGAGLMSVCGGITSSTAPSSQKTWNTYLPLANVWVVFPTLSVDFAYAAGTGWNPPKFVHQIQLVGGITVGGYGYTAQPFHALLDVCTKVENALPNPPVTYWGSGLAAGLTGSYLVGGSPVSGATLNIAPACYRWDDPEWTWSSLTSLPFGISFPQCVSGEASLVLGGGETPRFAVGTTNAMGLESGFETGVDGWDILSGGGTVAQTFDTLASFGDYSLFLQDLRLATPLIVSRDFNIPNAVNGGRLYLSFWARTPNNATHLTISLMRGGSDETPYSFQVTDQWRQCNIAHSVPSDGTETDWTLRLYPDPAPAVGSSLSTPLLVDQFELYPVRASDWVDMPLPEGWEQTFPPNVRTRQQKIGGGYREVQNGYMFNARMQWPYLNAEQLRMLQRFAQARVPIYHPNPSDCALDWWSPVRVTSGVGRQYPMDVLVGHVQSIQLEGLDPIPVLPDSES